MRIFTYPNPFEINKNQELWGIVTKHPHFCASDTLVQGLEAEYGRTSFGILRTISALMGRVLGDYTNNPQNDIQMFLTVSSIIREFQDSEMKTAYRFNIADVVEAVKFLIMLECDTSKFDLNELTEEQAIILEIYEKVQKTTCVEGFEELKHLTKEDFIVAARCSINDEIEYLCNRSTEYATNLGIIMPIKTPKDGFEAISKIIKHLNKKMTEALDDNFASITHKDDLDRANYILTLITETDDSIFEKIIVHGVHKITPTMYFFFKLLDSVGVEVIFLINYAQNLPNVYKTWKDVYSWVDTKFEYQSDIDITQGKKLGIAIASVIEGKGIPVTPIDEIMVFENLTSFTDREVRLTFKKSGENLNKMRTQYYAVRGESSNEILKMYFPEQFKQKPFLSYPIGQFILGIYQMWDFEADTLKLSDKSLCECAVSNLFVGNGNSNVFEIVIKTKLYFSDIETVGEYYQRIKELETALHIIFRNNNYSPLQKLSFFNISLAELKEFKSFVEFIEVIANKLFKNVSPLVDFGKHFKILMDIISNPSINEATLSKTEQALISEITNKLSVCNDGEVVGSIEDVKDALCFYLAASKKGDTSNWIVRDFEQIDGAVLLRKNSKASYYHFALLSNANMTNQDDEVLPWPLSNSMFIGYADAESAIPVVTTGLLERRNFLKFTLFYGAFFTKCNIKLSYISEENGEEQTPYYLLNVLGLDEKLYQEEVITTFETDKETLKSQKKFSSQRLEQEIKEIFSICPYKFLQNAVIKAPIEYSSNYHIKYFVANFMYSFIKGYYNLKRVDLDLDACIATEFEKIQRLFPFWEKIVFVDIEKNTRSQLYAYKSKLASSVPTDAFHELRYEKRKENFLIAQWTDEKSGMKYMNFNKSGLDTAMEDYMLSSRLYPTRAELPHKKVCDNCNFSEICLRDYYEARTALEGDE